MDGYIHRRGIELSSDEIVSLSHHKEMDKQAFDQVMKLFDRCASKTDEETREVFRGKIVVPVFSNLKVILCEQHKIYPQGTEAVLTLINGINKINGVDQDAQLTNLDFLNYAPNTQTTSPLQTKQLVTNINADSTLLSKKTGSSTGKNNKKL